MGLFGLPFPEEYGGMGGDYFALVPRPGGAGPGRLLASPSRWRPAVSLGAMPIYRFGTEEQKRAVAAPAVLRARCWARSA